MKKIISFALLMISSVSLFGHDESYKRFMTEFTAGYVFKHDCAFKEVYGHGIVNAITADGCYFPWKHWGFGAKVSYWRAKGKTSFLQQCTLLQEVPVTVYLRALKNFRCGIGLYGSLGGGFMAIKEKSYLGCETVYKGIGEIEVGALYPVWKCFNITGAFRYVFPPQCQEGERIDVGGCDLRAGIGFTF